MRYWHLDRAAASGPVDLSQVTGLVAAIGQADASSFATEVLNTLGAATRISQCTIFAYEFGNRPRTVSVADHRGGRLLRDVADVYSKLYYVLDGNQGIVSAAQPGRSSASMVIHQQASDEIVHEGYRVACYSDPNVCDRLSLMLQPAEHIWLSVNLYRDRQHANFQPQEIALVEALAPLVGHAARHHYALHGQSQQGIPQLMLARLRSVCPTMAKRELDVVRGVLEGYSAAEIGDILGIKTASVVTYQKRAYQRLGISSQRQLFALCLSADKP
jgi:DNA-binding CsgD family transcriptional regulator